MRIKVFWLSREDMVRFGHSEYRDFYLTRYTVRSSKVTHPEYFSAPALPTVTDLHHSPVHERLLSVTELYPERCRIELERRDKDFGGRRIRTVFDGRLEQRRMQAGGHPQCHISMQGNRLLGAEQMLTT